MGKWLYGGEERRARRWPRDRKAERDARAIFGGRRLRPWVIVAVWIALVALACAIAWWVGNRLDRTGRWGWVSPEGRAVADEVSRW